MNTFYSSDFETVINNTDKAEYHTPYCFGFYSENYCEIFYKSECNSENAVYKKYIQLLFNVYKHNNNKKTLIIYHNLSSFDGYFILECFLKYDGVEYLKKLYNSDRKFKTEKNILIEPLIKDNQIICIKIYSSYINTKGIEKKKCMFLIKDSYLILPASLNKLAVTFLNESKSRLIDITEVSEKNYCSPNIKKNVIKYLKQDLYLTYEVYKKATLKFKSIFNIDIVNKLTAPSISLYIYKKKYLDPSIHLTSPTPENIERFIRQSYIGGRVEVLKPIFNASSNIRNIYWDMMLILYIGICYD